MPTPRHSVDEHTASAAANRTVSQGSSPLTHPSSSGPAAKAELEAAYRQQLDSLTPQLEAAGLIPEWLKRFSPDEAPKQRRTAFPKPKQKLPTINIFNIIKDWIGKPFTGCKHATALRVSLQGSSSVLTNIVLSLCGCYVQVRTCTSCLFPRTSMSRSQTCSGGLRPLRRPSCLMWCALLPSLQRYCTAPHTASLPNHGSGVITCPSYPLLICICVAK